MTLISKRQYNRMLVTSFGGRKLTIAASAGSLGVDLIGSWDESKKNHALVDRVHTGRDRSACFGECYWYTSVTNKPLRGSSLGSWMAGDNLLALEPDLSQAVPPIFRASPSTVSQVFPLAIRPGAGTLAGAA
ncbi:MAG: hypothetical protein K8R36_24110, partial [Planctomycetales bacterium]|nr:hypothetical protein [Planctomycetales bacterium]